VTVPDCLELGGIGLDIPVIGEDVPHNWVRGKVLLCGEEALNKCNPY